MLALASWSGLGAGGRLCSVRKHANGTPSDGVSNGTMLSQLRS